MSLIFLVLVGTAMAVMAQMMDQSLQFQKERDRKAEYLRFVGAVRNNILNPHLCAQALRGRPISVTPLVSSLAAPFVPPDPLRPSVNIQNVNLNLRLGGVTSLITNGWSAPENRFTIDRIQLATIAGPIRTIRYDVPLSPFYRTYLVRLYLVPRDIPIKYGNRSTRDRSGSLVTYESKNYYIDFYANVGPTNRIFSCHGVESEAALCESAGGAYYTDATNPAMRCHPWARCWTSQVGLVNSPGACRSPFNRVERVGLVGSTNRYLCSWCNRNL